MANTFHYPEIYCIVQHPIFIVVYSEFIKNFGNVI